MSHEIRFTLNGVQRRVRVELQQSALSLLRDTVGLTGTKYGCGEGECGACTIIVDGASVNSCLMFAIDCDGREVVTIEGLERDPTATRLRQSFVDHGAVQCGFCTPGMVIQGRELLLRDPHPSAETVQRAIEGNLCRCTGYKKIIDAIVECDAAVAKEDRS